tara:strand:- start:10152 stop:10997 length:846 start_codon:yes stop_codon:yes gene_type:complete
MERRTVWILNLDAELEWSGQAVSADVLSGLPSVARAAALDLLGPGDVLLGERVEPGDLGRAWCPTESTRARFLNAGITPEASPDLHVVRRANERGTWSQHGLVQDDSHWVTEASALDGLLQSFPVGTRLRAKRLFTVAGRGQLKITTGSLSEANRGWFRRSLAMGGLTVEPEREVLREWSMHAWLEAGGSLKLGSPVQQILQQGHWLGSMPATELDPDDAAKLLARTRDVAEVLRAMGYFGPFGIDAMHVRESNGATRFLPLTEVNARYTLSHHASGLDER